MNVFTKNKSYYNLLNHPIYVPVSLIQAPNRCSTVNTFPYAANLMVSGQSRKKSICWTLVLEQLSLHWKMLIKSTPLNLCIISYRFHSKYLIVSQCLHSWIFLKTDLNLNFHRCLVFDSYWNDMVQIKLIKTIIMFLPFWFYHIGLYLFIYYSMSK